MTVLTEEQIEKGLASLRDLPEFNLLPWQEQAVRYLLGKQPGRTMLMAGTRWGRSGIDRALVKIMEAEGFVSEVKDHYTIWSKPEPRPEEGIRGYHADRFYLDEAVSAPPDPFLDKYVLPIVDGKFKDFKDVRPGDPVIPYDPDSNAQATMNYIRSAYNLAAAPYHYQINSEGTAVSNPTDLFNLTDHDLNIWRQIGSPMKNGKVDVDALRHVPRKKPSSGRFGALEEVDVAKVLADNTRLQEKQKNQKKELSRLNTVIKLQSLQAINANKLADSRLNRINRETQETLRFSDQLTHEKAVSSYWHNKFKDLKVKYKETKRELRSWQDDAH